MSAEGLLAALGIIGAASALVWPGRAGRRRRLARIHRLVPRWRLRGREPGAPARWPAFIGGVRRHLVRIGARRSSHRGAVLAAAGGVGVGCLVLAGPVGGLVGGAYAGVAAHGLLRGVSARARARERADALDALAALAADLRAGLPPLAAARGIAGRPGAVRADRDPATVSGTARRLGPEVFRAHRDPVAAGGVAGQPGPATGPGRLAELAGAAWRLAEQTGAPLADLVERIEADGRALDRTAQTAAAQAAGARATAWLLAALPLGGIGLGYGIGVDPLQVLLHTPLGVACATGAVVLQLAGLAWADRLTDVNRPA